MFGCVLGMCLGGFRVCSVAVSPPIPQASLASVHSAALDWGMHFACHHLIYGDVDVKLEKFWQEHEGQTVDATSLSSADLQ